MTQFDVPTQINHLSKSGVSQAYVPPTEVKSLHQTSKDNNNWKGTSILDVPTSVNHQSNTQASQSQETTLWISSNIFNISNPNFKQFQEQVTQMPYHIPIKIFPLFPNKDQQVAKLQTQDKESFNSQQIIGISTPITPTDPSKCNYPIGGRLIHFQEEWKKLGAQDLISRGISAKWILPSSIEYLMTVRRVPDQRRELQCGKQLETLIEKELQNKIIEEVKENQIK
ncbi:MAG: hypothetical protein EZS28_050923 [Streblomastix strix]|uniref:Uncharacterized protein n=1 Tax=Streblomastix strix TaxID=222440 RepID=A0A5J4T765_9EUKA|nr:MAG: hypothetical protein EZS28_050923 [Streblomastix strix]